MKYPKVGETWQYSVTGAFGFKVTVIDLDPLAATVFYSYGAGYRGDPELGGQRTISSFLADYVRVE